MVIGVFRRGLALAQMERAVIAVQRLGYVTAQNWAYIAPFGCRRLPQLACRRGSWSRFQSQNRLSTRSWWLSTTSPAILQRLLQHSGFGRMAWPGNAPPWVAQRSCSSALAQFASGTA